MSSADPTRVIIVDDDDVVRDSLQVLLEAHDFPVIAFGSAREFLESGMAAEGGCLILDLHRPEMTEFDVLRRLNGGSKGMKAIVIAACGDEEVHRNAVQVGASTLLERPFAEEDLVGTIRKMMTAN